jgi:exopolysaccharide production protein ExoZ
MLFNIQYLRFVAASLVVLHHAFAFMSRYWHRDSYFDAGAVGVDIFFVISGFIMVFITEKKEQSPLRFFYHRIARLAPPYWVVTFLVALALDLAPISFSVPDFSFPHFLASMLFFAYPHPGLNEAVPLYGPGWTLNYEFFFYSIFSVALAINVRRRVALVSSALLLLVICGCFTASDGLTIGFYTNPILLEFIYGMLIGHIVNRGITMQPLASIALIALGVAGLIMATQYWPISRLAGERFLAWGLPSAILVAGSIFLERNKVARPVKTLLTLGDASYAIYATHYIVLAGALQTWRLIGLPPGPLLIATGFAITVIVGVSFHRVVERPLVALFSGRRISIIWRTDKAASRV